MQKIGEKIRDMAKKRKITITAAKWKQENRREADKIINLYLMCTIWALHTREGFGKKRLDRVCRGITEVANDIAAGRLTPEDIRRTVAEETGFEEV